VTKPQEITPLLAPLAALQRLLARFDNQGIVSSTVHDLGPFTIRLPTPEDLIILKAVARRPKDLLDIQVIIESHTDLDKRRIERWVREFAQLLEMPEVWDDIAPWLQQHGE